MLRDWSDEWKNARLALALRGDELFQGETLRIVIYATVVLDATPALDAAGSVVSPASPAPPVTIDDAIQQLEARWRRHCDGALVDLKVVEPAPGKAHDEFALPQLAPSTPVSPSPQLRTTLFHQESRLALLPLRPDDVAPATATNASILRVTLVLQCECTLRVRAEFWQRPLTLVARVTPSASHNDGFGFDGATAVQPLTSMLLNDAFTRTHVFGRLREQTSEPPNLTRRVEHKLRIVKPLVLKMDTKFTSGQRVVIVARATNTHNALGVRVLDLQLHINQFAGGSGGNKPNGQYRVAKAPTDEFPVDLAPHEQYNFVFIVEPTGVGGAPAKVDASHLSGPQSLLTLSWETKTEASNIAPLLQPITEHHTILWSPYPHRAGANAISTAEAELLELLPRPPPLASSLLSIASENPESPTLAVRRGDRSCLLSVKLTPFPSDAASHRVGVIETLCVIVANRSQDGTEFDVSLVVPPSQAAQRSWLAFESAHHLGRLRPGTIIRKSVRVVFLRHGRVDLNGFLLYDHVSGTWFLPPLSSSASMAWDVFVHPNI